MLLILNDAPRFSPLNLLLSMHFFITICVIFAVSSTVKLQIKSNLSAERKRAVGRKVGPRGGRCDGRRRNNY